MPRNPVRVLMSGAAEQCKHVTTLLASHAGFTLQICTTQSPALPRVTTTTDVVLCRHPSAASSELIAAWHEGSLTVPWVALVGPGDEDAAIAAVRAGAVDAVRSDSLGRLASVLERAVDAVAAGAPSSLASFLSGLHAGVVVLRLDGSVAVANARFAEMLGYAPEEAGRLWIWDWDDQHPPPRLLELLAAASPEGRTLETRHRRKDGSRIDVEVCCRARCWQGQRLAFCTCTDITERKRAERALREAEERAGLLLENALDAVITTDHHGIITRWNREAERMFRLPAQDAIGSPLGDRVIPEGARPACRAALQRCGDSSKPMPPGRRMTLVAQRADGEEFPVEVAVTPIRSGGELFFNAFVRDITELRQIEQTRRSLESQLRQAQKMEAIGALAGGIAHDFNNILAAIVGNVEMLRLELGASHPSGQGLAEIMKAAQRATTLVRQILTFSRRRAPDRQVLALAPVVEESLGLLRATLPACVELATDFAPATPGVLADPAQIHQILLNLCTNAWHALDGNPGRIAIGLRPVTVDTARTRGDMVLRPGCYVELSVSDDGHGMDAATLERIFEPFFTTKPPGQGSGLGLAVVHGIVRGHDGVILVDSAPGGGAVFRVYLPAMAAPVEPDVTPPLEVQRGHGERVLFIDDEVALVKLGTRMLEQLGYQPIGFTRPGEAMAAFRARPDAFQAVITDFSMPALSGLELAEEVHLLRPQMPLLLTSGFITAEVRSCAQRVGILACIQKPVTLAELSTALHRALSRAPDPAPR